MKYKIFSALFLEIIADCAYSANYDPFQPFIMIANSNYYRLPGNYRAPPNGTYNRYELLACDQTESDTSETELIEKPYSVCISKAKFKKIIKKLEKLAETQQMMYTSRGRAYRVTKVIPSKNIKKRTLIKNPPSKSNSSTEFFHAPSKKTMKKTAPSVFQEIPSVQLNYSEKQSANLKTKDYD